MLSIISSLLKPTQGTVLLEDKPVSTSKNEIGYMLQQDYLFPWKTIEENILLGLKLSKQLNENTKTAALNLLEQIGLKGVENSFQNNCRAE